MDILESLELRWFLPAGTTTTDTLQTWFGSTAAEEPRVDHYLVTGRPDLGFKARLVANDPAKVETKYLVGSLGMVAIGPGITGELQRWTKLSLEVEDKSLQRDGAWLAVNKTRFLRKFAVDMSGAPPTAREVPVKDRPSTGCGVELTRLDYSLTGASVSRYTFGFEAFGPKMRLLDVLQTVCVAINSQSPLPELRAEWSASYPAWLIARRWNRIVTRS